LGAGMLCDLTEIRADVHVMLVDHKDFKNAPRPDGQIVDARGVWG